MTTIAHVHHVLSHGPGPPVFDSVSMSENSQYIDA